MARQPSTGEELVAEFNDLFSARKVWDVHLQLIGDYIHGTSQQFNEEHTRGERLNENRYASEGVFASRSLSSALVGMLWPNGARSMKLTPAQQISEKAENKEYFEWANDRLAQAMDDPLAGLVTAVDEYMLDNVSFGYSGIGTFQGEDESDLYFEPYGASQLYIDEGRNGRVNTVFRLYEWPIKRIVDTFGIENVSKGIKDRAEKNDHRFERVKLLRVIRPRKTRDVRKRGNLDMPFESITIELETKKILKESGFNEQPVKVARFRKLPYETYGRSPGMEALSDVLELDYLTERFTVNIDKTADPPLMVLDDGRFGGGVIDTSAGAMTVVDMSGRINNNIDPIKPLFTTPELRQVVPRLEMLQQKISEHFFLDKLLDFNNTSQMTLGEVQIRDRIRGAAMGSVFSRQIAELFTPLVSRAFALMLDMGKLGVVAGSPEEQLAINRGERPRIIPEEVAKAMAEGENVFEVKYFTPAARALQAQKAEALNEVTAYGGGLAKLKPEALDLFDSDEMLKMASEISGIPSILKSQNDVDELRKARAQATQQAQEAQQIKEASEAAKNVAPLVQAQ